jgi:hypothetical protein
MAPKRKSTRAAKTIDLTAGNYQVTNHADIAGSKALLQDTEKYYGKIFDLQDALTNSTSDPEAAIAAAKNLGEIQIKANNYLDYRQDFMSAAEAHLTAVTAKTSDYAKLIKMGAKGANTIRKEQGDVKLTSIAHVAEKQEFLKDYDARHRQLKDVIALNAQTGEIKRHFDYAKAVVDGTARMRQAQVAPVVAQLAANKQYHQELIKNNLTYGEQADDRMVARRDYAGYLKGNPLAAAGNRAKALFSQVTGIIL